MNGASTDIRSDTGGDACEFESLVGPFVDGELPLGERDEVDRHLDTCDGCARLAKSFHELDELARRASLPPSVSADEWGGVWQGVQDGIASSPASLPGGGAPGGTGRFFRLAPVLAAAALLALGVWIGYEIVRGPVTDDSSPVVVDPKESPEARKGFELDENGEPIKRLDEAGTNQ